MNDYDQLMYSRSKQPIKTFDGFVSVLKELGYIRQNSVPVSPRHNQEQSIKKRLLLAYQLLSCEGVITDYNLSTFLQAVHGINPS